MSRPRLFRAALRQAERQGFLRLQGGTKLRGRLQTAWRLRCLERELPYISWEPGSLQLELHRPWWLTGQLHEALCRAFGEPHRRGRRLGFGAPVGEGQAAQLLECLLRLRPRATDRFESPPPLAEGWARVTFNECYEDTLPIGERCVIREIAGMAGHVEAWRHNRPPLVGIHLERFQLVREEHQD